MMAVNPSTPQAPYRDRERAALVLVGINSDCLPSPQRATPGAISATISVCSRMTSDHPSRRHPHADMNRRAACASSPQCVTSVMRIAIAAARMKMLI